MLWTACVGIALGIADIKQDIVYRKVGEREVKADFYPPAIVGPEPAPFVIVIHGGGWTSGNKKQLAGVADAFSKAGLASACIEYRLAPQDKWPAMIDDCQAAVRFFRANAKEYRIDPANFAAAGASAGGHLSLLLGSMDTNDTKTSEYRDQSSRVKAVLNFFGPTDLREDFDPIVAGILCQSVLGKKYDKTLPEIASFSPVTHMDAKASPVFTIHGLADTLVPPKQVDRLSAVLKSSNVEHQVRMIEGMGHTIDVNSPKCVEAMKESLAWLLAKLGKPAPR